MSRAYLSAIGRDEIILSTSLVSIMDETDENKEGVDAEDAEAVLLVFDSDEESVDGTLICELEISFSSSFLSPLVFSRGFGCINCLELDE